MGTLATGAANEAAKHAGHGHAHAHAEHLHADRGHGHGGHGHAHGAGASERALVLTLALTLSYFAVEIFVAVWSGSLSLLADAGHMLTDGGTLALSLVAARIAARPRSLSKTYGYRRAEVIGALVNSSAMLVISCFIVFEALTRLQAPPHIQGHGLLITASIGLGVSLLAVLLLARSGDRGLNMRSALLHVAGDALGSLAAIAAGVGVAYFSLPIADPLASLAIALVLIVGSLRLLSEAAHVLMESTPPDLDLRVVTRTILDTPGVREVHDLHVWCLTPAEPMLTAHVVLTGAAHGTDVAKRVGERLRAQHGLEHVTIQPEPPEQELVALRVPGVKKKK